MNENVRVAVGCNELIRLGGVLAAACRGDAEANASGPVIIHNADKSNGIIGSAAINGGIGELEVGVRDGLARQADLRREDRLAAPLVNVRELVKADRQNEIP